MANRTEKHDPEMEQFQADLLESVRQMKAGRAARTTMVALTPAADARAKVARSHPQVLRELVGA